MSRHLDSSTTTQMTKIMVQSGRPVVPLEKICMVILWQDYHEKDNEKIILSMAGRKFQIGNVFVHREKGLFLSMHVDDIKLDRKHKNIDPMWKVLNKEGDLGETASFLDHVFLGCTQRQC